MCYTERMSADVYRKEVLSLLFIFFFCAYISFIVAWKMIKY
uniref:Uncharacterized protein n=1 Tax=Anguilla anguilla TaxID=7936 RepID=A0A0E9WJZ3_ANGAN